MFYEVVGDIILILKMRNEVPSHAAGEWLDLPSFIVILFSNYDLPSVKLEKEIELGLDLGKKGHSGGCPLM